MLFLSIAHHYFLWHYSQAFQEIFHVWKNIMWFNVHFFSITQLISSWFSPWKRITENRGSKWNLEDLAGFVIIGLISRIIGFVLRTIIITLGLICLLVTFISGITVYAFWIIAPIAIITLIGLSLTLLIL